MLSEHHNSRIDFRCTHELRMMLTEVGRRLAVVIIPPTEDVFHLVPVAICATGGGTGAAYSASVDGQMVAVHGNVNAVRVVGGQATT